MTVRRREGEGTVGRGTLDPGHAPAAKARGVRPYGYVLLAAWAVAVLLACTSVTRLTTGPASALTIQVRFEGALIPGDKVKISVGVFKNGDAAEFSGGQRLTVNDVTIHEHDSGDQHTPPTREVTIPRPSSEGGYTLAYSDEHGNRTVAYFPAPRSDLTVLDLAPEASVPVPAPLVPGAPAPTATSAATTPLPRQPRPPTLADAPLTVRYTTPYPPDMLRTSATERPKAVSVSAFAFGTCPGEAAAQCGPITGYNQEMTGSVAISDEHDPYGFGFERFEPGPGSIKVSLNIQWPVKDSGFADLTATFGDTAVVPITWVYP